MKVYSETELNVVLAKVYYQCPYNNSACPAQSRITSVYNYTGWQLCMFSRNSIICLLGILIPDFLISAL